MDSGVANRWWQRWAVVAVSERFAYQATARFFWSYKNAGRLATGLNATERQIGGNLIFVVRKGRCARGC